MKNKKEEPKGSSAAVKAVTRPKQLFGLTRGISGGECMLYESLRENIPIIDAAIRKIIRLIGGFKVECSSPLSQSEIDEFLATVKVGSAGEGIGCFLSQYVDSLLCYGTAVGEIVTGNVSGAIRGLYNADIKELDIIERKGGMGVDVRVKGEQNFIKNKSLITISSLNPTPAKPLGSSLLSGLPFVSAVLMKIYESIGTNFDRLGNLRFAVTYNPPDGVLEGGFAEDRAEEIAREWSAAMSDGGTVRDFVAVGDVNIRVIGADNQIIDTDIPVRQMLEQIISKLGLPPFLLGLSWSTTERMSAEQSDILTSELWHYRSILEPVILKICREFLIRSGLDDNISLIWDTVSLRDEVETARARLINVQAEKLEKELKGEEN